MKLIAWFMGTDALTLVETPPGRIIWKVKLFFYRIKWRILKRVVTEFWVVSDTLTPYLIKFGIPKEKISIQIDRPYYTKPVKKIKHDGFKILYYMPTNSVNLGGHKFIKFVYGYDIFINLRVWFADNHDIHFVWVNGNNDMTSIYPTIDLYIRPTRNDGEPRMIMECDINNIPYIFSRDGKPNVDYFIKEIQVEYEKHTKELSVSL